MAETAEDTISEAVETVIEDAVEEAIETVEARAEAAEAALEAITDSARRDALHDMIEEVTEGLDQCRQHHASEVARLEARLAEMETEQNSLRDQMTELANRSTVVTVQQSTPPASEQPKAPETTIAVETVNPENAVPAVIAERHAPAKVRRWI